MSLDDANRASALADPDRVALERLTRCRPALTRISPAAEALGINGRVALHAGPPYTDLSCLPTPVVNAVTVAALFEEWVSDPAAVPNMLEQGAIRLVPAQDVGAVVPLAAVITPTMKVLGIEDIVGNGRPIVCPLNGGVTHAHRFGVCDRATRERVRWLNSVLAARLVERLDQPIELLPIAVASLESGDDCHGATRHGTAMLGRALGGSVGWQALGPEVFAFMRDAHSFFLNPWMAASRCILSSLDDMEGAAVIVGMGGNGQRFGVRISGRPNHWLASIADPPEGPWRNDRPEASALPAIGDSAVIEALGLGAVAWCRRSSVPEEMTPWLSAGTARAVVESLGCDDDTSPFPMGACARRLARGGAALPVSLGVLDSAGHGLLGRGVYFVPPALFPAG